MRSTILNISFLFLSVLSAPAASGVFDYDDFGPQAASYPLIGHQWYQWNSHGASDPQQIDPIKIVVYWDESLEQIKKQYPVIPEKNLDYRYLQHAAAVAHVQVLIREFRRTNQKDTVLKSTLKRLMEMKVVNKPVEVSR